jgi:hypothetical protein
MFEPLPEKAPHMAGRFLVMFGLAGGAATWALSEWLFGTGSALTNSDAWFLGSFGLGAIPGVMIGWKLLMPAPPVKARDSYPTPKVDSLPHLSPEELLAIAARLNTSAWVAAIGIVGTILWGTVIGGSRWIRDILLLFHLCAQSWFAVCVGAAASALNEPKWRYVGWVMATPFLALLRIPIVSTLIGLSPLSIKFLLVGQLERRIRERTFEE